MQGTTVRKLGNWTMYPAHGIPAPVCVESQWSRDNHLGNGLGGQTLSYNWTIPDAPSEHCVLRIRYVARIERLKKNKNGYSPRLYKTSIPSICSTTL